MNNDIAPSRKRFIPKVWRKLPFTSEEIDIISNVVNNVKGRVKYVGHKEYYMNKTIKYRKEHWERTLELGRIRRRKLKEEVLSHYGKLECINCGETDILKLSLDHVNNDGKQHRELETNKKAGYTFYRDLKNRNFPQYPPLQILCMSCNLHKKKVIPVPQKSASKPGGESA